jgi:molecular chaperone DnaK
VSAKDLGTGKQQQITITGGTALPRDDIDRMVRDAEAHANEDRQRREAADARNQGDHIAYQTEKMLKDYGDRLGEAERAPIQAKLDELHNVLKDGDAAPERIRSATDALLSASQVLGQKIYESSQAQAAGGGTGPKGGDDVVEAEIVDEGDQAS